MIKVLIADDHFLVRKGIKQLLLEKYPSITIEEAEDIEMMENIAMTGMLDLFICDINMWGKNSLDTIKKVRAAFPVLPILIISMHNEEQYAMRVIKAGATGFVNKNRGGQELLKAIELLLEGKKYFPQTIIDLLASSVGQGFVKSTHEKLSGREFDVMKLLVTGRAINDIADDLSLTASSVSTYRKRVMNKIGLKTNAALIKYVLENHLID